MERKRLIVKRGGSYFIKLSPADMADWKLFPGDWVIIDDMVRGEKDD